MNSGVFWWEKSLTSGLFWGKSFPFLGRSGNPIIDTLDIFPSGSPLCNLESTEQQIKYVFYIFFLRLLVLYERNYIVVWPFTIVDSFTVFTISAITISPIHCTHTYTVSLSVVVKDSFICYVPHTHTHARFCWCHCLVCVGPQTLQQHWVSGLYLSQPSLCCSGYNSKVTHVHTGKWKKNHISCLWDKQ